MTLSELEAVLEAVTTDLSGGDGAWEFRVDGVHMACLTDNRFDRMRIIAPIIDISEITDAQRDAMLEANFHRTLDARYATSHGVVYAAFMHPLGALDERGLASAVEQVSSLVLTFDDGYSSGALHFASGHSDVN